MISRREFGVMVAGLPLSVRGEGAVAAAGTAADAVRFGLQTFSFHDLPPAGDPQLLPTIVSNMVEIGRRPNARSCRATSSRMPATPPAGGCSRDGRPDSRRSARRRASGG